MPIELDLKLTEQEANAILQFIHIGLKSEGRGALMAAFTINMKLEQAIIAAQKASNDPLLAVMPPVSESAV